MSNISPLGRSCVLAFLVIAVSDFATAQAGWQWIATNAAPRNATCNINFLDRQRGVTHALAGWTAQISLTTGTCVSCCGGALTASVFDGQSWQGGNTLSNARWNSGDVAQPFYDSNLNKVVFYNHMIQCFEVTSTGSIALLFSTGFDSSFIQEFAFHDATSNAHVLLNRNQIRRITFSPTMSVNDVIPLALPSIVSSSPVYSYDANLNRVLLLDPIPGSPLWTLDLATNMWSIATTVPPTFVERTGCSMAFDPARAIHVIHGGKNSSGQSLGDVWHVESGVMYRVVLGASPIPRSYAGFAYRPQQQDFLLWSGVNPNQLGDTWHYVPGMQGASYQVLGAGCAGSAGVPVLNAAAGSLPIAGQTFISNVSSTPFFSSVFMALGFSNTQWNGVPLPRDMTYLGMPGCSVFTSLDAVYPTTNVFGVGVWSVSIPPSFRGATFYNQAVVFDPAANAAGLSLSNAAKITVGF